ncbi:MAG: SDR family oxidoreductase [Betaproteobacteria bacterium]|nr:SDR family oxidoreductase [Betaproteobacteria bacterium]
MASYEELQLRIRARPRTWAVTGVAGFIGSHLLENLLKLEQRVIGLDNFSSGNRGNLAQVKDAVTDRQWRNFRFIEGDIHSLDTCRQACRGAEFALHHAALGSVPLSITDPIAAHDSNATGFLNMLVAAHGAGLSRFVYAGSSATYGDHPGRAKIESEIGQPLSPYAVTKYVNELYAGIFARCYGFRTIGLRYFNVYGPRQDPNGAYAAVIPTWIAGMIRNEPVYINGDGATTRDFCYVDNVVQANLLAALVDDPAAVNQVYNIAVNETTTLNELFEAIRSLLEPRYPHLRDFRAIYRGFRAGDVPFSLGDIDKARRLLGYRPAWRIRQGLERTIDWYVAKLAPPRSIEGGEPVPEAALS